MDISATHANAWVQFGLRVPTRRMRYAMIAGVLAWAAALSAPAHAAPADSDSLTGSEVSGPVRLSGNRQTGADASGNTQNQAANDQADWRSRQRYVPGEFEIYVNKLLGVDLLALEAQQKREQQAERAASQGGASAGLAADGPGAINPNAAVRRLGADLTMGDMTGRQGSDGPQSATADYLIGIGDEVQVTIWGSADADMRLTVDRSGRITIPRVGPILVAGVRNGDLNDVIRARVAQVFKNFQVSTSLGKLRTIRIYVTGFTSKPGAYNVSALSTIMGGLIRAGGPSSAGSFRQIELRRNGQVVAQFDAYDLLLKGDKSADRALQAEDVIHIGPVGPQVAILGSVNKQTIAELKPGESVEDVLAMAGGFNTVADRSRLSVERLSERNERRVVELQLPQQITAPVGNGDILRVFSSVSAQLPQSKQYKRIRVEGEVSKPGEYVLPPGTTLQEAIRAAGGLTPLAYVFGADFSRESVRESQQQNYDRALRDLETELTRSTATQRAINSDDAAAQAQRVAGSSRLIERLKAVKPTGRIVLQLEPDAKDLPPLTIEDGDKLLIPPRPTTVGVFGSVFNAGSYLLTEGSSVEETLKLAGGPTRGADPGSIFVLRANGGVVSTRQSSSGWFGFGSNLSSIPALPGDTVFVPEEMNKTTFVQEAKEWTAILYQFGLGAAALKTIRQ